MLKIFFEKMLQKNLTFSVCFEYFSKKDAKYPLIEKSVSIRVLTL